MLSDYLRAQMDAQGLKPADIARRARSAGKKISPSNIAKILNQQSDRILVGTADALAAGLRVPLLDVVLAALNREHEQEIPNILQQFGRTYRLLDADQQVQIDYLLTVTTREMEHLLRLVDTDERAADSAT